MALLLFSSLIFGDPCNNSTKTRSCFRGIIIHKVFTDKGLRKHPEIQEYYFWNGRDEYFIKTSECLPGLNISPFKGDYIQISGEIRRGMWDSDDPKVQSRTGSYIVIDEITRIELPYKILFHDLGNNTWDFTQNMIRYEPVSPEASSSGVYDGGKSFEKTLAKSDYTVIFMMLDKIISDEKLLLKTRRMPSAIIKLNFRDHKSSAIADDSPLLQSLLLYLCSLSDEMPESR